MVKKVSAILLALVLCFSVVALPASAAGFDAGYTVPSGKKVAYKVTLDKETYNPGDTAIVSIYVQAESAAVFGAGAFALGLNSAIFTQTDNPVATIKAASTGNATYTSFYKEPKNSVWAYVSGKNLTKITSNNTSEENGLYDEYLKITIARNQTGSHANAGALNNGLPATEVNAETEPYIQFPLKVSESATPGSTITIGVTTGSITGVQTYYKLFNDPGNSTAATNTTVATTDLTYATATATVAAAGPAVAKSKAEVKMTPNSATTVEDAFSFRVTSKITDADWDAYFANSADSTATNNAIKSVGFVAYKGTTGFNLDTAKAVAQGTTSAEGYDVATTDYIQKVNDTSDAYFGCRLEITSAATRSDVTYVAFVQYRDASGNIAYAFYDAEQQALLNTNYDTIVSNYLAAYHFAG